MVHQMKVANEVFKKFDLGEKVFESRLYDEKRQLINLGDEIIFTCNSDSKKVLKAKVKGLVRYSTFEELFTLHNPKFFGGKNIESLLKEIKQFYSDDQQKEYGVLGIHLQFD